MAAIVTTIASWLDALREALWCLWDWLPCTLWNLMFDFLDAGVTVLIGAIAWIPIPSEVSSWSWPDAGPIVGVLGEVGFAQATAIVAGAMSIKFLLRLIPFVRL